MTKETTDSIDALVRKSTRIIKAMFLEAINPRAMFDAWDDLVPVGREDEVIANLPSEYYDKLAFIYQNRKLGRVHYQFRMHHAACDSGILKRAAEVHFDRPGIHRFGE